MKKEGVTGRTDINEPSCLTLAARGGLGGVLMGLANLVPGISGGTMLLASGIYPRFIRAIAEVTTLKFRLRSLLVLGAVVGAAALAILLLAGSVKDLVVHHRWIMFSLFIGLTIGGVPIVWRMARPASPRFWLGAVAGFLAMSALALAQQHNPEGAGETTNFAMLLLAGLAGASAMILPGISGGYLLLVLGQYVPILAGIADFRAALSARETAELVRVGVSVILPVGLGVAGGVVLVSNLLRILLAKFEKATLGVLLGLLLGAVVGLWPFRQGIAPEPGSVLKSQVVVAGESEGEALRYEATGRPVKPEDWPTEPFTPTGRQAAASIGLVLAGLACTAAIARVGGGNQGG